LIGIAYNFFKKLFTGIKAFGQWKKRYWQKETLAKRNIELMKR